MARRYPQSYHETISNFDKPDVESLLTSIYGVLTLPLDNGDKEEASSLKNRLRKYLNWADIKINVAIIGTSGSGKSSFINSIRGKRAKDPGAAKVGYTETTSTCTSYEYPGNSRFLLWDIPGVGTPSFPENTYLEKITFNRYDFFIIISKDRITTNDVWLAREIQDRRKHFFFVRTNIDKDINDDKEDFAENHDEKRVLQFIKSSTVDVLTKNRVKDPKVFLINNRRPDKYDFGKIIEEMIGSCDNLKRDAIILSFSNITTEIKEAKKKTLKGRIDKKALDIASTSEKSDQKKIFQDEIDLYRQQFQIDDETLDSNKDILLLTDDDIKHFHVFYDENMIAGGMTLKTPTAMRLETSFWDRLADFFRWSKKNKLLFGLSKTALENNLELLYNKSIKLYDNLKIKQMVHHATK